jgi:FkbM family methyltransferase
MSYPKGNREAYPGDYLRYDYPLTNNSIVLDLGAHHGEFSKNIYNLYNCKIYSFEPVQHNYNQCKVNLQDYEGIKLYKLVLSNENGTCDFFVAGESSSIYIGSTIGEYEIETKKIDEFLDENGINKVDLIKMNIEGSEYELLEYIIKNNFIDRFENLQIQFHDNAFDGWREKYDFIIENLKKTHHLTYHFEFKFENWKKI